MADSASLHNACPVCGKPFTRHANLRRHMAKHSTQKHIVRCNICNKAEYNRDDSLIRHQKRCFGPTITGFRKEGEQLELSEDLKECELLHPLGIAEGGNFMTIGTKGNDEYTVSRTSRNIYPNLSTIRLPQTLQFKLPPSLPPEDYSPLNLESPFREEYLDYGVLYYTINLPLLHHATWDRSKAHYLLKEALIVRGASCASGFSMEFRTCEDYIIRALQSSLRNKIHREFLNLANDNLYLQFELLTAMAFMQVRGAMVKDAVERSINDGYHSVAISMLRHSGLLAHVSNWRNSFDISTTSVSKQEMWLQWIQCECIKRTTLHLYLLDALRPAFSGLPPCLSVQESDELELYLPADQVLWAASSAEEWLVLAQTLPIAAIVGIPLRYTVNGFYEGRQPMPEFDSYSCFFIVHCLLKAIYESSAASEYDQYRYKIKKALENWCQHRLVIRQPSFHFYAIKFAWVETLIYRLSVLIHTDSRRGIDKNHTSMAGWIEDMPDFLEGGMRLNL